MCAVKFKVPSGLTVASGSSSELRPRYSEGGRYEEARIILKCKRVSVDCDERFSCKITKVSVCGNGLMKKIYVETMEENRI